MGERSILNTSLGARNLTLLFVSSKSKSHPVFMDVPWQGTILPLDHQCGLLDSSFKMSNFRHRETPAAKKLILFITLMLFIEPVYTGLKSQIPLLLASPYVEAKSHLLSLKKPLKYG